MARPKTSEVVFIRLHNQRDLRDKLTADMKKRQKFSRMSLSRTALLALKKFYKVPY